jgi:hypothetical protein
MVTKPIGPGAMVLGNRGTEKLRCFAVRTVTMVTRQIQRIAARIDGWFSPKDPPVVAVALARILITFWFYPFMKPLKGRQDDGCALLRH